MPDNDLVVRVVTPIAASPERVWKVLTDLANYRDWHPNLEILTTVEEPVAVGTVLRLRTNAGSPAQLEFEVAVTDVDEPSVLAWAGGDRETFYGRHRFTLIPHEGGIELVNEETFTGTMAKAVLAQNRAAVEDQYTVGDAALKAVAEGLT